MFLHPIKKWMPISLFAFVLGITAFVVIFSTTRDAEAVDEAFTCDQIPAQECTALEALYTNTNGNEWVANIGWLQTSTPCSWYGVTCNDSNTNVSQIILSYNNLVGTIPPEIGNLSELIWLDLGANELEGPIPAQIGNLGQLRTLYLAGNSLSGSIPTQLGNLSHLELLYLNRNKLEGTIPYQIGNLNKLQFLYLDGSKLSGVVPSSICTLDSLVTLNLDYNKLDIAETDSCITILDSEWGNSQTVPPNTVEAVIPQTDVLEKYAIEISWEPILYDTDPGYYEILMAKTSGGPYDLVGRTIDKTVSQHTVRDLDAGTPYYFIVRTVTNPNNWNKNEVESLDSKEVTGTPSALNLTHFSASLAGSPLALWLILLALGATLILVFGRWKKVF